MPRLRNSVSGVVVNVDEATAAQLGSGWVSTAGVAESTEPAPESEPEQAPAPRRTRKTTR